VKRHAMALTDPVSASMVSSAVTQHVGAGCISTYSSAFRKYQTFCSIRDIPCFPVDRLWLCAYLLYIQTTVSPSSMKGYLSAISYYAGVEGYKLDFKGDELLRRTMRYLKREHPAAAKALKFPLSCAVLRQMFTEIEGYPVAGAMSHNDRLFVAASVIAVTCFLRGGEFCAYNGSHRKALRADQVTIVSDQAGEVFVEVDIRRPKNMFWLESCKVRCFAGCGSDAGMCDAAFALKEYRSRAQQGLLSTDGPAFVSSDGKVLSREFMISRSMQLLTAAGVVFVDQAGAVAPVRLASWRAGGVRSALDAGIPVSTIMALGRWRSLAWERYTVLSTHDIRSAMVAMWRAPAPHHQGVGVLVPAEVFAEDEPGQELGGRR
jgi:hypothetical protein